MIHITVTVPTIYPRRKVVCRCGWESTGDFLILTEAWKEGDKHLEESNQKVR